MVSEVHNTRNSRTRLVCLNPCFGGIWSLSRKLLNNKPYESLNPCFGGIWSLRYIFGNQKRQVYVS